MNKNQTARIENRAQKKKGERALSSLLCPLSGAALEEAACVVVIVVVVMVILRRRW